MPNDTSRKKLPIGYTVTGVIAAAGGHAAVAKKCEVPPQSVAKWKYIPSKHATKVAILAGLPIEVVRPDFVRYAYPIKG